jgi:hypothetical protein
MTGDPPAKKRGLSAIERRAIETKRDEDSLAARRAHTAKNLEKTQRLQAQRLAHEATLQGPIKKVKPKAKKKPNKAPKLAYW